MTHRNQADLKEKDSEAILLTERLKGILVSSEIVKSRIDEFSEFTLVYVSLVSTRKLSRNDLSKLVKIPEFEGVFAGGEHILNLEFHFPKNPEKVVVEEKGKRFKFFGEKEE